MGTEDGLKVTLDKYKNNPQLRNQHSITTSSRRNMQGEENKALEEAADMRGSTAIGRETTTEQPRL